MMERKEVKSSSIRTIGFDAKTKTLEIEFNSGGVYVYQNVPKTAADAFLNADSKGSHFSIHIRPCYQYQCVKPAPKKEPPNATEAKPETESKSIKRRKALQLRKIQPI